MVVNEAHVNGLKLLHDGRWDIVTVGNKFGARWE